MAMERLTGVPCPHLSKYSCRNNPYRHFPHVRLAVQTPDRHRHASGRWKHCHRTGKHDRVYRPATATLLTCQPPLCTHGNQPAQQVAAKSV